MRSLYTYSFLALTCTAVAGAQNVLDPSPARVLGHPSTTPAEQLLVNNLNPNLGANGGMYSPQSVAVDTSVSPPILYVADTLNNRILAWQNATSAILAQPQQPPTNPRPPDLIIGQPNMYTTFPLTNGGLWSPTAVLVDPKGNLYIADSGNNRILRYPAPFANAAPCSPANPPIRCDTGNPDLWLGQPDRLTSRLPNQPSESATTLYLSGGGAVYLSALAMDSSGNLFVVDVGNWRVLRYPAANLLAGAVTPPVPADLVVGQTSFTTLARPSGSLDTKILQYPAGLAFDHEGHLFVTDVGNRLVVFPPQVSTAPAGTTGITAVRFAGLVPGSTASTNPCVTTPLECTLSSPEGIVMINDGPAVMDAGNNRMLIFDSFGSKDWTLASGDTTLANPPLVAVAVLGQGSSLNNFTSTSINAGNAQAGAATFYGPSAGAVAGTDLFVADAGNHRVLIYPNAGSAAQIATSAAAVLGQGGFPYNSPNSLQGNAFFFSSGFSSTGDAGLVVDSTSSSTGTPHLYVSDPNNNRVLGFADARLVGLGVSADLVIGEPDLFTSVCNYGSTVANPAGITPAWQPNQSSLCYPTGLAVDPASGDLYIADTGNGRVLRFPAPYGPSGPSQSACPLPFPSCADLVLGQSAFTGPSNTRASQSVMLSPYGLVFDTAQGLIVSDLTANRVLMFPIKNATNGESASKVIGQPNYTVTTPSPLNGPHHIAEDSIDQLYVADTNNGRILVFNLAFGNQPASLTGLNSPQAVWVDKQNNVWAGDRTSLYFYPPINVQGNNTATVTFSPVEVQAAEVKPGQFLPCPGAGYGPIGIGPSPQTVAFCLYPSLAITQDASGAMYVADSSNRVAIHYPALAGRNGASSVCTMGCNIGPNTPEPCNAVDGNPLGCGIAPGAFESLYLFGGSFIQGPGVSNTNYPTPTTLGGIKVLVGGIGGNCSNSICEAPISYVGPSQINFIVPYETNLSSVNSCTNALGFVTGNSLVVDSCAPVQVVNASTQQVLASGSLVVGAASPGFFTASANGFGQIAADNCNQTPCDNTPNSPTNPANQGSVIQLYMTGQGLVGFSTDGQAPTGLVHTSKPVVLVGASQAEVQFSGLSPQFPGVWQLNIFVPIHPGIPANTSFPSGVFPVYVDYNGVTNNTQAHNLTACGSPPVNCATTIVVNPPQ